MQCCVAAPYLLWYSTSHGYMEIGVLTHLLVIYGMDVVLSGLQWPGQVVTACGSSSYRTAHTAFMNLFQRPSTVYINCELRRCLFQHVTFCSLPWIMKILLLRSSCLLVKYVMYCRQHSLVYRYMVCSIPNAFKGRFDEFWDSS